MQRRWPWAAPGWCFTENPGVEYPRSLARVKAGSAEEVAAAWGRIKQSLTQAIATC